MCMFLNLNVFAYKKVLYINIMHKNISLITDKTEKNIIKQ